MNSINNNFFMNNLGHLNEITNIYEAQAAGIGIQ